MFRFALSLLAWLFCFGCMSPQLMAQSEAKKIPAVRLSEAQIAKFKEHATKLQIVWHAAGLQSDGKIFACFVGTAKNPFGGNAVHTYLYSGTFESDGSFHQSPARWWSKKEVMNDCRKRGFEPPVRICQDTLFGVRCEETKPSSAATQPKLN